MTDMINRNKNFPMFCTKVFILILIIFVLCYLVSPIFVPKWDKEEDNYVGTNLKGLYAEERDTIDVFYVGNSSVFCGISPIEIWNEFGITGYNIAVGGAVSWTEYYQIKNYLLVQSPKMIVVDVSSAFQNTPPAEVCYRKSYDHLKMSMEKINTIMDDVHLNSFCDNLSFILPVIRFHDRWQELSKNDILMAYSDDIISSKGYNYFDDINPYKYGYKYLEDNCKSDVKLYGDGLKYLKKIEDLCKEENIELIYTVVPTVEGWDNQKHNIMQKYCNDNKIKFFDINTKEALSSINLDWEKDTFDKGVHLNYSGAYKVTMYLGNYVKENIGSVSYSKSTINSWNDNYINYVKSNGISNCNIKLQ